LRAVIDLRLAQGRLQPPGRHAATRPASLIE